MLHIKLPPHCRIAVPPGIGDIYWCLAKMADFRRKHGITRVTLCVRKSNLTRALDWPRITEGLVDDAEEFYFTPNKALTTIGWCADIPGVDFAMWPNAIVDQGYPLANWLPGYKLDLEFPIYTDPATAVGSSVVIYASSTSVNKAWFPKGGAGFWSEVIDGIADATGVTPILIGSNWDKEFASWLNTCRYTSMLGKTNLSQVAAILKQARVVVGIISGMTILSNHFGTPTIAIWPEHKFPERFPFTWTRPHIPYLAIGASKVNPRQIVDAVLKSYGNENQIQQNS